MTTLPPAGYQHHKSIEIRFGDLDPLGHVNNAKYLTYMEMARISYWRDVCGWNRDTGSLGMIMASAHLDFKQPLLFNDELTIYTRVSRLGNKSYDIEHVFIRRGKDGEVHIATLGSSTIVAFDYAAQQSVRVPELWRERIIAYEPDVQT